MSGGRIRSKLRRFRDSRHRRPHEDELSLLRAEIKCLRQEIAETREMTFAANHTFNNYTVRAPSLSYQHSVPDSLARLRTSRSNVQTVASVVDASSVYEESSAQLDAAQQSGAASSRVDFDLYPDEEDVPNQRSQALKDGFWHHRQATLPLTTKSLNKENADQLAKLFGNGGPRTLGRTRPLQSMNMF